MKIFVTGGTGKVGVMTVKRLVSNGHTVTVIGRRPKLDVGAAHYYQCDIGDFQTMSRHMASHDAVVHLAATPNPFSSPGREVFRANGLGTFNVYEAAVECGIRRVVSTSSINAFGYYFGDRGFPLRYLPIDESHPGIATDAYSFSKQIMERIGEYFWERERISGTMLRLPSVYPHDRVLRGQTYYGPGVREVIEELLDLSEKLRDERVAALHAEYDSFRAAHRLDKIAGGIEGMHQLRTETTMGSREFALMNLVANFFAYIDEADSAQAIEKSLTGDYEGCHTLFVNARRNYFGLPPSELAKLYWPRVPEIRYQTNKDDCLVSIDRARAVIGFEPEWSF